MAMVSWCHGPWKTKTKTKTVSEWTTYLIFLMGE